MIPHTTMENTPLLLRFPPGIRSRIYAYLGLIRDSFIFLKGPSTDGTAVGEWSSARQTIKTLDVNQFLEVVPGWTPENCGECFRCRPMATQLFYVSQAISEDVRSILYSRNFFMLLNGAFEGLAPLLNLTPVAIRSLHRLSIRLDPSMRCP